MDLLEGIIRHGESSESGLDKADYRVRIEGRLIGRVHHLAAAFDDDNMQEFEMPKQGTTFSCTRTLTI